MKQAYNDSVKKEAERERERDLERKTKMKILKSFFAVFQLKTNSNFFVEKKNKLFFVEQILIFDEIKRTKQGFKEKMKNALPCAQCYKIFICRKFRQS